MKVVLVGRMPACAEAGKRVADHFKGLGASVITFLGEGGKITNSIDEIKKNIPGADVLWLGMSHPAEYAVEEVAVGECAIANGVPFALYGDLPNLFNPEFKRPWFSDLVQKASALFTINEADAEVARERYLKPTCVETGNPLWEDFGKMRRIRDDAALRYRILADETMVLVPFVKSQPINCVLVGAVLEALRHLSNKFVVVLSLHPGDPSHPDTYYDLVQYAPDNVDVRIAISAKVAAKLGISTNDDIFVKVEKKKNNYLLLEDTVPLLDRTDLVIDSTSSIGRDAAYRPDGMPIITFFPILNIKRGNFTPDDAEWDLTQEGTAVTVYGSIEKLQQAVEQLLTREGFSTLKQKQKLMYPKPPEKGAAVRKMAETLESIAKN